jgi:hypothetical protein
VPYLDAELKGTKSSMTLCCCCYCCCCCCLKHNRSAATGHPAYLDAELKGTKRAWDAGLQLPLLMLNISKLQAATIATGHLTIIVVLCTDKLAACCCCCCCCLKTRQIGGYWSSGLPYLDAELKGTKRAWDAGLQLPLLMLNISKLQSAVGALPKEAWTYDYQAKYSAVMAGREGNQNAFKPGECVSVAVCFASGYVRVS